MASRCHAANEALIRSGDVVAEACPQLGQQDRDAGGGVVGHRKPDLVHELCHRPRQVVAFGASGCGTSKKGVFWAFASLVYTSERCVAPVGGRA